jgi:hypothetical protein
MGGASSTTLLNSNKELTLFPRPNALKNAFQIPPYDPQTAVFDPSAIPQGIVSSVILMARVVPERRVKFFCKEKLVSETTDSDLRHCSSYTCPGIEPISPVFQVLTRPIPEHELGFSVMNPPTGPQIGRFSVPSNDSPGIVSTGNRLLPLMMSSWASNDGTLFCKKNRQ